MSEPIKIPDEAMFAAANAIDAGLFAALEAAAPLIVAAELDRLAEPYREDYKRERQRANRLLNGGPKWQYESAITSYQELFAVARRLSKRAAELRAHPSEPKEA